MSEVRGHKTRPSYRRRIWGLARQLGWTGLNEFKLYDRLQRDFSELHIGRLSDQTARAFIIRLEASLKYQQRKRREQELKSGGVFHMPTPDQREKALWLMRQIGVRNPDAYLNTIARRTFQRSARQLSLTQYQAVIEVLKSIHDRPRP